MNDVGRRTKLTPELQKEITSYIEGGAYDWVAAQKCGIHPATFRNWMNWGENGNPRYVAFFAEVCRARAHARAFAEIQVRRDNPFAWLRYGPGRERAGEPGWTENHELMGPGGETLVLKWTLDGDNPAAPAPGPVGDHA